jgi:Glycosyl transferase family 2
MAQRGDLLAISGCLVSLVRRSGCYENENSICFVMNFAGLRTLPSVWANVHQAAAAAPDPPDLACRHARDKSEVGNIVRYHRAGRDKRPSTDHAARDDHRACAERRAFAHEHAQSVPVLGSLELAGHINRAGIKIVGEHRGRADEDIVLERGRLVNERVVLELDVVTDGNSRPDVCSAPDHAPAAQAGVFSYLGQMPDPGADAKRSALVDIGRLLNVRFVHRWFSRLPRWPTGRARTDVTASARAVVVGRPYLSGVTTVIIPAHNEARVIGRLLGQLVDGVSPGELDVIVVANGCTDDTAQVAAACGPPVRVLSTPTPSKREALMAGDRAALDFPRVYVDADVEVGSKDIRALSEALGSPGVLAVGPRRVLALEGRPWPVRWYYDVWSRLPEVRAGLFGRGVIGMNAAGHARVADLPPLTADDLSWSLMFSPSERVIVPEARSIVHTPRTFGDLLRRRVRAVTGVAQVESAEGAPPSTARTRPSDLLMMIGREPLLAPRMFVFLVVTVLARWRGSRATRRGDSTWLRDESSRV